VAVGAFGAGGRFSQGILTGLLPNVNSYFMVQLFEREFGVEVIDGVGAVARPVHENAGFIRIYLASGKSCQLQSGQIFTERSSSVDALAMSRPMIARILWIGRA
jgi:hypothetical protein